MVLNIKNDVLIGNSGWLYLWGGGQRQFEYLMGEPVSQTSKNNFVSNYRMRKKFCDDRGVKLLQCVYPSKPSIINEYLPDAVKGRIKSLYKSQYEHEMLHNECEGLLYPDTLLNSLKGNYSIYRRIDTHMTSFGYASVVGEMLKLLGHHHDPVASMQISKHQISGDLAVMLQSDEKESYDYMANENGNFTWDNRQNLPGNTNNLTIVHNLHSKSNERLLAIGDSFLKGSLEALSTFYRDILYVRSAKFQPDMVELFSPNAVITASTERYLSFVESDQNAHSVPLQGYGLPGYYPSIEFSNALKAQLSFKYYRKVYDEWVSQVNIFNFSDLGLGKNNNQISFEKMKSGYFKSTGKDPQIIFSKTKMKPGANYNLEVVMESDTDGVSQIFLGNQQGEKVFTEEMSVKRKISKGVNVLLFEIESKNRSEKIRFDPTNVESTLRIESITLSEK